MTLSKWLRQAAVEDGEKPGVTQAESAELTLSRQHYYRWLRQPVTDAEITVAYRANALFDAHRDDPESGYRFLVGEAQAAGEDMCERTAWQICRDNGQTDLRSGGLTPNQ